MFFVLSMLSDTSSGHALNGAEVVDGMSSGEAVSYIFGSIDAMSTMAYIAGDKKQSACMVDWLSNRKATDRVLKALERFRDREVQSVIYAMAKKECGPFVKK